MVHSRSSPWTSPDKGILAVSINAHHEGSLPPQLEAVWNLLLQAGPEGPTLITCTAPHSLSFVRLCVHGTHRAENSHQPLQHDKNERWQNSGAQSRIRNSPRSTPRSIIISIKTATSTAVTSSSKIGPPLWLSGVSLRPEIYRLQGCADRLGFI